VSFNPPPPTATTGDSPVLITVDASDANGLVKADFYAAPTAATPPPPFATVPGPGPSYSASWTPPCSCFGPGAYQITVKVTDTCGDVGSVSFGPVLVFPAFPPSPACALACSVARAPSDLVWTSSFEVKAGTATLVLNNASTHRFPQGQTVARAPVQPQANRADVVFDKESGAGLWRFQLANGQQWDPAGVHVLAGDALAITRTGIVFRLKGEAGERVSFAFDRPAQ
jgi:hypothetical protein